jgi:hypothetical protein
MSKFAVLILLVTTIVVLIAGSGLILSMIERRRKYEEDQALVREEILSGMPHKFNLAAVNQQRVAAGRAPMTHTQAYDAISNLAADDDDGFDLTGFLIGYTTGFMYPSAGGIIGAMLHPDDNRAASVTGPDDDGTSSPAPSQVDDSTTNAVTPDVTQDDKPVPDAAEPAPEVVPETPEPAEAEPENSTSEPETSAPDAPSDTGNGE